MTCFIDWREAKVEELRLQRAAPDEASDPAEPERPTRSGDRNPARAVRLAVAVIVLATLLAVAVSNAGAYVLGWVPLYPHGHGGGGILKSLLLAPISVIGFALCIGAILLIGWAVKKTAEACAAIARFFLPAVVALAFAVAVPNAEAYSVGWVPADPRGGGAGEILIFLAVVSVLTIGFLLALRTIALPFGGCVAILRSTVRCLGSGARSLARKGTGPGQHCRPAWSGPHGPAGEPGRRSGRGPRARCPGTSDSFARAYIRATMNRRGKG